MTPDQFTYWLQGFVETNGGKAPTKQQWQIIKDHLKLCFNKVTPHYPKMHPLVPQGYVHGGDAGYIRDGKYVFNPDGFYQGSGGGGNARNGGGGGC